MAVFLNGSHIRDGCSVWVFGVFEPSDLALKPLQLFQPEVEFLEVVRIALFDLDHASPCVRGF